VAKRVSQADTGAPPRGHPRVEFQVHLSGVSECGDGLEGLGVGAGDGHTRRNGRAQVTPRIGEPAEHWRINAGGSHSESLIHSGDTEPRRTGLERGVSHLDDAMAEAIRLHDREDRSCRNVLDAADYAGDCAEIDDAGSERVRVRGGVRDRVRRGVRVLRRRHASRIARATRPAVTSRGGASCDERCAERFRVIAVHPGRHAGPDGPQSPGFVAQAARRARRNPSPKP
jgi:hypothetical protein